MQTSSIVIIAIVALVSALLIILRIAKIVAAYKATRPSKMIPRQGYTPRQNHSQGHSTEATTSKEAAK